jgi:hypothetical protein
MATRVVAVRPAFLLQGEFGQQRIKDEKIELKDEKIEP